MARAAARDGRLGEGSGCRVEPADGAALATLGEPHDPVGVHGHVAGLARGDGELREVA